MSGIQVVPAVLQGLSNAGLSNLQSDEKLERQGKRFVCHSAAEVEPNLNLFAAIIAQARLDSMPEVFFSPNSLQPIFRSFIPDAYDAFNFFMTGRVDIYAYMQGLDPEDVVERWAAQWDVWRAANIVKLHDNLTSHLIRLITRTGTGTADHMDAVAFYKGPQYSFWCTLAGRSPQEMRQFIEESVGATMPAAITN